MLSKKLGKKGTTRTVPNDFLTEKHMRLIEERSLAKLRAGMNDGKIL